MFGTRLTRRAGLRRRLAKNGLTLRGENGTVSEKRVPKQGPAVTSSHPKIKVLRHFQGFPKIQVEIAGAGKGGGVKPVQYGSAKINEICCRRANKH